MIFTKNFYYDGVRDGLQSAEFYYRMEDATGDPDRSRTYYEKFLYKSDPDPEMALLPFYRMCRFFLRKGFKFGLFRNRDRYELSDDLLRLPLSYWLVRPKRSWRRWQENPIKFLYQKLDFNPDYGCYLFVDRAFVDIAEKLSEIIRFVLARRGKWREVTRNDCH